MDTTQDTWQPVAFIPATLSNDHNTTVEVVTTDAAVYLAAYTLDADSNDTRMTPAEARQLASALLEAADLAEAGA